MAPRTNAAERALNAASRLFYERGITSTGVDLVAEASGVAKTTMYANFGSKDGLVAAYLRQRSEDWRDHLVTEVERRTADPRERLLAVFDVLAEWMDGPEFRGCPFINAAGELPDRAHPGVAETTQHRIWLRGYLTALAEQAGLPDAAGVAADLLLLYDAAMVHGALDQTAGEPARRARRAAGVLIEARAA